MNKVICPDAEDIGSERCLHCVIGNAIESFAKDKRNRGLEVEEAIWALIRNIGDIRSIETGYNLITTDEIIIEELREIGLDVVRRN